MHTASWSNVTEAPLYQEHLLLGALFGELEAFLAAPLHYGNPQAERESFAEGCALSDLTGMTSILVTGEGAESFIATACACEALAVGSCSFGAVVTGDGSIASVPLVARTGNNEYLVLDPSERGLMLQPWLQFLANIEQNGFKPFASVKVEDATDALVPLLLWGPQARAILADYVPTIDALPEAGHIRNVRLDRIECLVACLPLADEEAYVVFAPPAMARTLWRSFLSFGSVAPVGIHQLGSKARASMPWMKRVLSQDRFEATLEELLEWELARAERTFVGARALES